MLSDMACLVAEDLTKIFRVYDEPRDRLLEMFGGRRRHKEFVALRDISFSLRSRETLGIIGNNGAGKSTLLKILARTLTPTSGRFHAEGRVMALLELGSGFNPEFTGRENIYLNASLFGMSRQEIRQREQAIIDFADIGPFIDRPVKTYSSGMYVRLAFSIATSVDPDILIIDEALSVGDELFQKKCVRRMNHFREAGKIILFCSHSLYQVNILCDRAIWIDQGQIRMDGTASTVTRAYEDWNQEKNRVEKEASAVSSAAGAACRVLDVAVMSSDGRRLVTVTHGQSLVFNMEVEATEDVIAQFGFAVVRGDGLLCCCAMGNLEGRQPVSLLAGQRLNVMLHVESFPLLDGSYRLVGGIVDASGLHFFHQVYSEPFVVTALNYTLGITGFPHTWELTFGDDRGSRPIPDQEQEASRERT